MRHNLICSFISKSCISSILWLFALTTVQAQAGKTYATLQKDTIPFYRGVAVSADLVGLAQMAFGSYGQYEGAVRVNLKDKYFPILEVGYGKADAEDVATRLSYQAKAPYGRVGMDFNLMKDKHDVNRIYGGFRYAYTNYRYDIFCPGVTDPTWGGSAEFKASDVPCTYHWMELVFGVDAKVWGPVRLGWSARYKRRLSHDDGYVGRTWYVPGFGKQGNARLGGTFNVIIEL